MPVVNIERSRQRKIRAEGFDSEQILRLEPKLTTITPLPLPFEEIPRRPVFTRSVNERRQPPDVSGTV